MQKLNTQMIHSTQLEKSFIFQGWCLQCGIWRGTPEEQWPLWLRTNSDRWDEQDWDVCGYFPRLRWCNERCTCSVPSPSHVLSFQREIDFKCPQKCSWWRSSGTGMNIGRNILSDISKWSLVLGCERRCHWSHLCHKFSQRWLWKLRRHYPLWCSWLAQLYIYPK